MTKGATSTTAASETPAGAGGFCDAFPEDLFAPSMPITPPPPKQVEAKAVAASSILEDMERLAPAEIADTVTLVVSDMRAYLATLEKYGYSLERMAQEASTTELEPIDGDSAHFSAFFAYLAKNCPDLEPFPGSN